MLKYKNYTHCQLQKLGTLKKKKKQFKSVILVRASFSMKDKREFRILDLKLQKPCVRFSQQPAETVITEVKASAFWQCVSFLQNNNRQNLCNNIYSIKQDINKNKKNE